MRTSGILAVAAVVLAVSRTDAAQVIITNRSGETLWVGVFCRDHGHYQPMAGNAQKAVVANFQNVTLPNVHPGNYTITALTQDRAQSSEHVVLNLGVNEFIIEYVPQGPPGGVRQGPAIHRKYSGKDRSVDDDDARGGMGDAEVASSEEIFIPHMNFYYRRVPYDNGTFGAQLTRDPVPGSPATQVWTGTGYVRLEQGDTIFEMDGIRFRTPDDVRNHRAYTTIRFIDSRTGQTMVAGFNLP